jgi:hypothetical protein
MAGTARAEMQNTRTPQRLPVNRHGKRPNFGKSYSAAAPLLFSLTISAGDHVPPTRRARDAFFRGAVRAASPFDGEAR